MRVLLISANTETINMSIIPVGLGAVAAACKNTQTEVEFLDLMNEKNPEPAIKGVLLKFDPQIIGISVRNIDDQSSADPRFLLEPVKKVVALCRENSRALIVLGGAGYSIFPESALAYLGADLGIQGEGEIAFRSMVARLESGKDLSGIAGLCFLNRGRLRKPSFATDLDSLPLPEADLFAEYLPAAGKIWMPFQTKRGCPMNCSYCSTSAIEGKLIRRRSPKSVIEALARYADAGFRQFFFTDNMFNLPGSHARALCRLMLEAGLDISWRCIIYPKKVDQALVKDMADAGCQEISLGFESGCENILRNMNKRYTPDEVRGISRILGDHGIRRMGFLLLGGPGETKESVEKSLEFADSLNLEAMRITCGIRIYPFTGLAQTAGQEGLIKPDQDLLFPKFYLARGLEDWLLETVKQWAGKRPNWIL